MYLEVVHELRVGIADARRDHEARTTIGDCMAVDDVASDLAGLLGVPRHQAAAAVAAVYAGGPLAAVLRVCRYYDHVLAAPRAQGVRHAQ